MACKVVFFFNQGKQGWTETYYHNDSVPFTLANTLFPSLIKPMTAFRASSVRLEAVRCTFIAQNSKLSFTKFNEFSILSKPGVPLTDPEPDVTSTSALYSLYDSNGKSRRVWFRGLRDSDVVRDSSGVDKPTARLNQQIGRFIDAAGTLGLSIRTSNRGVLGANLPYLINSIAPLNLGSFWSTVTFLGPATFLQGDNIVFTGIDRNALPGFPRIANVLALVNTSPWSVTIPYTYRSVRDTWAPGKAAYFYKNVYSYNAIASGQFEDFGEHKTGRAFFVPRGRSRSVVRAH
jgi:hypothetical protein